MDVPIPNRHAIADLARRYGPLEASGMAAALAAGLLTRFAGAGTVESAFVASIAETVGYYAPACVREVRSEWRLAASERPLRRARRAAWRSSARIATEFGVPEAIDTPFVRPWAMATGERVLGDPTAGIAAGKIAADVVFYALAPIGKVAADRLLPGRAPVDPSTAAQDPFIVGPSGPTAEHPPSRLHKRPLPVWLGAPPEAPVLRYDAATSWHGVPHLDAHHTAGRDRRPSKADVAVPTSTLRLAVASTRGI